MSNDRVFDLILRGGRVICPASGVDAVKDVGVRDGAIAAIEDRILEPSAKHVIDVGGKLVLPGLIDTHAHVCQFVSGRFGLNADMVGVRSCVTTVVDQGGPSCMTLPGFRHFVVEPAKTRTVAFLSAYVVGGLEGHYYPQLYSPEGVDVQATVAAARANKDIVRGVKAHAEIGGFARWGIRVIEMAAEIGRLSELPVYVHFGQLWGLPESGANGEDADTIAERVIPLLKSGDVLAPRSRGTPAASSIARARSTASFALRSSAASKWMSGTAAISRIVSRKRLLTPASSRTRWAPTCMATTHACRPRPERRTNIPTMKPFPSSARPASA